MLLVASAVGTLRRPRTRFNGHPPLGVSATDNRVSHPTVGEVFQWAPTLGGECYFLIEDELGQAIQEVSMGTHPWG